VEHVSRLHPRHAFNFTGGIGGSNEHTNIIMKNNKRKKKKSSAIRAPALLSLLQDLRTNIVKNTTVTVYEFNSTGGARRVHGSTYILN